MTSVISQIFNYNWDETKIDSIKKAKSDIEEFQKISDLANLIIVALMGVFAAGAAHCVITAFVMAANESGVISNISICCKLLVGAASVFIVMDLAIIRRVMCDASVVASTIISKLNSSIKNEINLTNEKKFIINQVRDKVSSILIELQYCYFLRGFIPYWPELKVKKESSD
jgi:hypothetical protein